MAWGIPTQDLPTFADGFMRGYGFVNGLQNQQARLGIQQQREERAQQRFDMQKQAFDQNQAARAKQEKAAHLQRELGAAINAYKTGGIEAAQPYWARARKYTDALPDITTFLAKDYGEALQTADYGLQGKMQLTPEVIASTAHTLFPDGFNKGLGEKTADGHVLTGKRPVRFYPHPDPNLVIPEYEVTRQRPDGTTDTYLAPHTPNRLSTDQEVSGIPIPELVDKVKGLQLLRGAFIEAGGDPRAFQGAEHEYQYVDTGSGHGIFDKSTGQVRRLPSEPGLPNDARPDYFSKFNPQSFNDDIASFVRANVMGGHWDPQAQTFVMPGGPDMRRVGGEIIDLAQQLAARDGYRNPSYAYYGNQAAQVLKGLSTPQQLQDQALSDAVKADKADDQGWINQRLGALTQQWKAKVEQRINARLGGKAPSPSKAKGKPKATPQQMLQAAQTAIISKGKDPTAVYNTLVKNGIPKDTARKVVGDAWRQSPGYGVPLSVAEAADNAAAQQRMGFGANR